LKLLCLNLKLFAQKFGMSIIASAMQARPSCTPWSQKKTVEPPSNKCTKSS